MIVNTVIKRCNHFLEVFPTLNSESLFFFLKNLTRDNLFICLYSKMDTLSSRSSSTQAQLVQLKISSTLPSYRSITSTLSPSSLSSSSSPSLSRSVPESATFSAGSIQPSRVRLLSSSSFLRASHNQLSFVHVPKLPSVYTAWEEHVNDQQYHRSTKRSKRVQTSTASTSSVTSPYLIEEGEEQRNDQGFIDSSTHYSYPIPSLQTPHEIMSIDIVSSLPMTNISSSSFSSSSNSTDGTWTIGTIDSYGSGCVSTYEDSTFRAALNDHHQTFMSLLSTYNFRLPAMVESSWTGLSISPSQPQSIIACAHGLQKQIYIMDNQRTTTARKSSVSSSTVINQYSTLLNPTALQYFPLSHVHAHCLAVTEGNALRIIDPRISTSSPKQPSTIFRDYPSGIGEKELLYALSIGEENYLTVAGTNSMIYLYDLRSNRLRTRWNCPTKHHIIGTQLHESKEICYIAGADQEILGWKWNSDPSYHHHHDANAVVVSASGGGGGGGEGRKLNNGGFTGITEEKNNIVSMNAAVRNNATTGSNKQWIHREQYIQHAKNADISSSNEPVISSDNRNSSTKNNNAQNEPVLSTKNYPSSSSVAPSAPPPKLARAGYRGSSRWIGFSVLNNGAVPSLKKNYNSIDKEEKDETTTSTTKDNDDTTTAEGDLLLSVCDDGYVYFLNHAERMI